jgi:predicted Zn-dependent peptidase
MGGYKSPEYVPADLITDILANGQSSRFYRRLLMPGQHFADIDASILGTEHPGLLMVNAKLLNQGPDAEKAAIEAIHAQLYDIANHEVDPSELNRCINRLESERVFSMMNPLTKAQALAQAEMHNERLDDIMPHYRAVTPATLRSHAASILNPSRAMTLIYRPQ